MSKVINFELFKDQKKLEKEYMQFCSYCNKYFVSKPKMSAEEIIKRLYFATRYLEGTVNMYMILSAIGMSDSEHKKGIELFCSWLEGIIDNLKE